MAISEGYVTEVPQSKIHLKGQENSGPTRMLTSPDLNFGDTSPDDSVEGRAQQAVLGLNRVSSMQMPSSSMTNHLPPQEASTEIY